MKNLKKKKQQHTTDNKNLYAFCFLLLYIRAMGDMAQKMIK